MVGAILVLQIIIVGILAGQSSRITGLEDEIRRKGTILMTDEAIDGAFGKPDYIPEKNEKPKLPRKKTAVKKPTTLRKVK